MVEVETLIVYVPRGDVRVTVMGLVARPGTLEVQTRSASWECWRKRRRAPEADPSGILRRAPVGQAVTSVINISGSCRRRGRKPVVQPGDVIYVRRSRWRWQARFAPTAPASEPKPGDGRHLAAGGATENPTQPSCGHPVDARRAK